MQLPLPDEKVVRRGREVAARGVVAEGSAGALWDGARKQGGRRQLPDKLEG